MDNIEKHLVFKVHDQLFTINVLNVNTIIQMPRVFKVPQAPEYILGVVNVEGDVIPVIDTGVKLDMGVLEFDELSQIIIMQRRTESKEKFHRLGFLVTEVTDVVDVDPLKMQYLPTSRYHFDERLVDGMHQIGEQFCMQVNVEHFYVDDINELLTQNSELV